MNKGGFVYIMASKRNGTIYIGVTSKLIERVDQHKHRFYPKSFTAKYKIFNLVYYEEYGNIEQAISREKQLKAGSRQKKIELIESMNPKWKDLFKELTE